MQEPGTSGNPGVEGIHGLGLGARSPPAEGDNSFSFGGILQETESLLEVEAMSWLGTDLVALTCIAGGAVVGGAATLELMDFLPDSNVACAVEARSVPHQRISISHGSEARAIVVTPGIRVRSLDGCENGAGKLVQVRVERELGNLEAELAEMEEALELQMEALEGQLEVELAQQIEAKSQLREAVRQMERARVKIVREGAGG